MPGKKYKGDTEIAYRRLEQKGEAKRLARWSRRTKKREGWVRNPDGLSHFQSLERKNRAATHSHRGKSKRKKKQVRRFLLIKVLSE